MNYYDEEINLNCLNSNQINTIKVEKLPRKINDQSDRSSSESYAPLEDKQQSLLFGVNSVEVNEIVRDMGADVDKLSEKSMAAPLQTFRRLSVNHTNLSTGNESENSDTNSDDNLSMGQNTERNGSHSIQLNITTEKLDAISIPSEVKDLLPFILKYTPQHIDTPYHLQPFVPDYVPAVGDVDAFLKVTIPPLPQQSLRHVELNEHLNKMGLHYLDEPAGEQSEPSLMNMKLRSVLTGSSVNPRTISASLHNTATKAPKDIDKWIAEVEQVHQSSSLTSFQIQPRKDMDALMLDWPRVYADANLTVNDAYQRCMRGEISLLEYIRTLSEIFEIHGLCETQSDYLMNIQTLFALYLVAYQAWE